MMDRAPGVFAGDLEGQPALYSGERTVVCRVQHNQHSLDYGVNCQRTACGKEALHLRVCQAVSGCVGKLVGGAGRGFIGHVTQ